MRVWIALLVACGSSSKEPPVTQTLPGETPPPADAPLADAESLAEFIDPKGPVTVAVSGDLDDKSIRKTVHRNLDKIAGCYDRAGSYVPMHADFVIGADGRTTTVTVTGGTMTHVSCMTRVFHAMQFPKPADGKPVRASYPLEFIVAK